jgi:hypothetical protein
MVIGWHSSTVHIVVSWVMIRFFGQHVTYIHQYTRNNRKTLSLEARWILYLPPSLTQCPHSVFVCFVWIWEQTAIISLYNINWLVFITETVCLLRGTDMDTQVRYWQWAGVLFQYFLFSPVSIIPQMLHTYLRYISVLPEGQTVEAWEPSKKQCSFGNRTAGIEKYSHFIFKVLQRPWNANVFDLGGSGTWEMWRT